MARTKSRVSSGPGGPTCRWIRRDWTEGGKNMRMEGGRLLIGEPSWQRHLGLSWHAAGSFFETGTRVVADSQPGAKQTAWAECGAGLGIYWWGQRSCHWRSSSREPEHAPSSKAVSALVESVSTSEQLGWLQRTVGMLPPVGLPSINGEDRSSSGRCKADITNLIGEENVSAAL